MKRAVIGLGFGDEGKGLFTNYLCGRLFYHCPIVVRFNGGHQAGHTVVKGQSRHVFSNFGSGTLVGIPTYWSEKCTVEPTGLLNELNILSSMGYNPKIYINGKCPIVTPFEIRTNQMLEIVNKHGSCGVGFGATIEREENFYSLTFVDLFFPAILIAKLESIKNWYGFDENNISIINKFITTCGYLTNISNINIVNKIPEYENYIYEGAQGLLLDQNNGIFPNVTRSNTGCKYIRPDEVYLITRAYQTRHGNGFMTTEGIVDGILENPDETNKSHPWQGKFRRGILDLSLVEYGIIKDDYIRELKNKNLVITCLDHLYKYRFVYKGIIYEFENENDFINKIGEILKINNIYISHGPEAKNITRFK